MATFVATRVARHRLVVGEEEGIHERLMSHGLPGGRTYSKPRYSNLAMSIVRISREHARIFTWAPR